ncbi:adenylate cyclase [Geminocystis sp. NIES-3708]|uniref:CHAD domain-containing protein n=1 Tax=Geminocystis sp. NIES-3708 TaxID=1615909 RepID=UPI0005FC984F|nr:CHAD domain-containing protein [Geminocystis sp. NIES-3708]BAQ61024.1 adenylate cyclase [Geminocystis sp. NIES-3708]
MSAIIFKDNSVTLADYSYNAIAKQVKKILKYEKKILIEEDPENLHQLRVAMRRLRSILSVFNSALKIPSIINDTNISNIARFLGQQRDLDILKINLEDKFSQEILEIEHKFIQKIIADISKPSSQDTKEIKLILSTKNYQKLKQSLIKWLEKPEFKGIANIKIKSLLSCLLLPQISNFCLQSGWLIGTKINENQDIIVQENLTDEEINLLINKQRKILHTLRKQAKKTRYQLELFIDFYPEEYKKYLYLVEQVQEILGNIQDNICLENHLTEKLGKTWLTKLPTLHYLIMKDQSIKWQEWQKLQEKFLDNNYRNQLTSLIIAI